MSLNSTTVCVNELGIAVKTSPVELTKALPVVVPLFYDVDGDAFAAGNVKL